MRAATPANEPERLAALRSYAILDTPREPDFDAVVAFAAALCATPIAVINLIDEGRQWFKAEVGLGVRETPIDTSLCAHAILQTELLIVPDTLLDARFCDNALCLEAPKLRFYAGALLKSDDDYALGTLCILDKQPRNLDKLQRDGLQVLADQVMAQIKLRRAIATAHDTVNHSSFLNAELQHRTKNLITVIGSIAQGTFSGDRQAFSQFMQRLQALSRNIDELTQQNGRGAFLDRVVRQQLDGFSHAAFIQGEAVFLTPDLAQGVSLATHELATNATKYGAWSVPGGRVDIGWTVHEHAGARHLDFHWRERGGPVVTAPARRGFGSRLLMAAIPHGVTAPTISYDGDGLEFEVTIQLPESG